MPSVKSHYGLGEQSLAVAMLAAGVGAIAALLQAGRIVARHGPRRVALAMGVLSAACIGALLASRSYGALLGVMLAYGASASLFDVAINAEASEIERRAARPLMSGFHGMFSLGGMVGAGAGSALAAAQVAAVPHLAGAALACSALVLAACARMLPRVDGGPQEGTPLSLPRGPLALLGLLAAIGLVAEGAMYDWSVLYLRQEIGTAAATAALGYTSFSAAMAAGRFGGDALRARLAPVAVLRGSGTLGALGMALALLVPHPAAVLVGFALVGLGFANIVPVLFSAASQVPGVSPAHGIAAVSSAGYLGMMAGPPAIGFIAEGRSLGAGLALVVLFAAAVALAARRALPR
ncbi:Candidate transporter [Ramlibacter tataouinensis TTB310]|uniref:Candidate transporter n=1 Tax=Ramlibacter tataouinensis (strain ATCC BAA-407 / DSM 14655 / LMG 21543 / TTB310) TaxID=365046 RepID=F5Y4C0_RAMTT|nr:Candidate transporter [Ramlibacter tataouinensis TTB310]